MLSRFNPGDTVRAFLCFSAQMKHIERSSLDGILIREGQRVVGYGRCRSSSDLEASAVLRNFGDRKPSGELGMLKDFRRTEQA